MSEQASATETMTMPKHGEFCWTEIATTNLEACKTFYTELFGWNLKQSTATDGEMEYQEYSVGENYPAGGMFQMEKEMYGGTVPPPHFMNYITVDSVDDAAGKVFDLGGKIVSPPADIPNVGRFCVVQDPTGATFSMITLKS